MLTTNFRMEKMLIMLFSYNFGDKKTDEKLIISFQKMDKMLVIKFHCMEKKRILLFSYTYFCSMKLYERV